MTNDPRACCATCAHVEYDSPHPSHPGIESCANGYEDDDGNPPTPLRCWSVHPALLDRRWMSEADIAEWHRICKSHAIDVTRSQESPAFVVCGVIGLVGMLVMFAMSDVGAFDSVISGWVGVWR